MCTLGFVVIGERRQELDQLTRGDMGLFGLPHPLFALGGDGISVRRMNGYYYLYFSRPAMTGLFYALISSPAGDA